ncbi:hypothetical protein QA646_25195 (plasmid) [Rhizobium sp. CB3090]|nr:hypothetical protein [Rhizobium sp. CB3090]WFU12768.1 hypothetical protein QA646_25195 [Rhizobium sp. CB3090]
MDAPSLAIPEAAGVSAMWAEAKKYVLAETSIVGTYQTA